MAFGNEIIKQQKLLEKLSQDINIINWRLINSEEEEPIEEDTDKFA